MYTRRKTLTGTTKPDPFFDYSSSMRKSSYFYTRRRKTLTGTIKPNPSTAPDTGLRAPPMAESGGRHKIRRLSQPSPVLTEPTPPLVAPSVHVETVTGIPIPCPASALGGGFSGDNVRVMFEEVLAKWSSETKEAVAADIRACIDRVMEMQQQAYDNMKLEVSKILDELHVLRVEQQALRRDFATYQQQQQQGNSVSSPNYRRQKTTTVYGTMHVHQGSPCGTPVPPATVHGTVHLHPGTGTLCGIPARPCL